MKKIPFENIDISLLRNNAYDGEGGYENTEEINKFKVAEAPTSITDRDSLCAILNNILADKYENDGNDIHCALEADLPIAKGYVFLSPVKFHGFSAVIPFDGGTVECMGKEYDNPELSTGLTIKFDNSAMSDSLESSVCNLYVPHISDYNFKSLIMDEYKGEGNESDYVSYYDNNNDIAAMEGYDYYDSAFRCQIDRPDSTHEMAEIVVVYKLAK